MRYLLLGPVEVHRDGGWVSVLRPRRRALLAYLLLHRNTVVSTAQLIDALWGGAEPTTARNQIQADVSALRYSLRRGTLTSPIVTRKPGYAILVARGDVDLDIFDQNVRTAQAINSEEPERAAELIRSALGLWRGQPLADVAAPFAEPVRNGLQERWTTTCELLADAELAAGRHRELIAELTPLVGANPERERLVGQLMLALYRSGRPADAMGVSRSFRGHLVEHHGMDPTQAHNALETAILSSSPTLDWVRRSPVARPAGPTQSSTNVVEPPSPGRPHQLPAPIGDFVGRRTELALLERLLTGPTGDRMSGPLVVISGIGGIGKTTLALRVAQLVKSCYPDGMLFADLRAFGAVAPADPYEVLGVQLRSLGITAPTLPSDADERVALFRSITASRRLLVLLDDAADEAQVRPLIPGGEGCAVVVTSRLALTGLDGAGRLALRPQPSGDARELLASASGVSTASLCTMTTERILAACAGLPLAVRLAGARLAGRPGHDPSWLADRLGQAGRWLDELHVGERSVRADLRTSYDAVGPEPAKLLRLMSRSPLVDVSESMCVTLFGGDPDAIAALVDELVRASLVDPSATAGSERARSGGPRFEVHQLVRAFARERAQEDAPSLHSQALDRILARYLRTIDVAGRVIANPVPPETKGPETQGPETQGPGPVPGFHDANGARSWLALERRNLHGLASACVGLGRLEDARRISCGLPRDDHAMMIGSSV
jgi:DNA-binding SARP family transcriptional activator